MNTFAIDSLIKQRDILIARKIAMMDEINLEIRDIESAIKTLSGRNILETVAEEKYDDQNPNYIKASIEEI
jgi:hypothetical protein